MWPLSNIPPTPFLSAASRCRCVCAESLHHGVNSADSRGGVSSRSGGGGWFTKASAYRRPVLYTRTSPASGFPRPSGDAARWQPLLWKGLCLRKDSGKDCSLPLTLFTRPHSQFSGELAYFTNIQFICVSAAITVTPAALLATWKRWVTRFQFKKLKYDTLNVTQ